METSLRRTARLLTTVWQHPANRGVRARKLIENVAFQVNGRVRGRRHVTRVGARSRLWADVNLYTAARVVVANPPDWPEMLVWKRFLRPGDRFVDVGANVGLYSIWAIEQGASVIAVEPLPAFAALLRENLALNGYEAEVVQAALGPQAGRMHLTSSEGGRNHLVADAAGEPSVEVDVLRLDDVARGRDVRAVKIDVEGAELRVLLGAPELMRRVELIQVEWNEQCWVNFREPRWALAAHLRKAGFLLSRASDGGRLVVIEEDTVDFGPDVFAISERSPDAMALAERHPTSS